MICIPQVQKLFVAPGNDRLKLLVLYSGEDDERLRKAAAGTLAMLTSEQPELCARIPATVSTAQEVLCAHTISLSLRPQAQALLRKVCTVNNGQCLLHFSYLSKFKCN